jgi:hypothetical protein
MLRITLLSIVASCCALAGAVPASAAVTLPPATTTEGYVCRLLINEAPFPGERSYRSEEDTKAAMESLLHVLDARLNDIPKPYTQTQVAATTATDIIDVITAGGVKGQFDGFYRDASGKPVTVQRVGERVDNLVKIANTGTPGKFARLLDHAGKLSTEYVRKTLAAPDRFASVTRVEGVATTGGAYAWMTDEVRYHPGGNFVRIPDEQQGSLGGNRFFTLRKEPK